MERLNNEKLIVIDGAIYHVASYEEGRKKGFKKGAAYLFKSVNYILPFRGEMNEKLNTNFDHSGTLDNAGVYSYGKMYVALLPKGKNRDKYKPEAVLSSDPKVIFETPGISSPVDIHAEGDVFKPYISSDNDLNMKAFKAAVSLKEAPETAYDERIYNAPIGRVASSRKSNFKKTINANEALASTKFVQYCEMYDLDVAIVIKDKKKCPFPMITNGRPLVIFADDEFEIKDPVNIREFQDRLNMEKL